MQRRITRSGIGTTEYESNLGFDRLRQFQLDAIEWYRNDETPVCAVSSPTGSGKTAIFGEIAESDESHRLLLTYPTNALLRQQLDTIEEITGDLNVVELSSRTLTGHGKDRLEEVLSYAQDPRNDVIVTNPDILQALLSHMYGGDTGEGLEFFKHFSCVVYDEFHFYDTFALSGLFVQIKAIERLTTGCKILLTSATPDTDFLDHIEDYLRMDVKTISTDVHTLDRDENPTGIDVFRETTIIEHHPDQMKESFVTVGHILSEKIRSLDDLTEPSAAVIFNSAFQSNKFQEFVEQQWYGSHIAKDNGYDTKANRELPDEFAVLNTTSKGEVGLDYDIDLLLMQCPYDSHKYIQRAGRAGRRSPAKIHVFGVGSVDWPKTMPYPEFEDCVYRTFHTEMSLHKELLQLRALRTAVSVKLREDDSIYRSPDVYQLTDTPQYKRWKSFVDGVFDYCRGETTFGLLDSKPNQDGKKLLEAIFDSFEGMRSLRGVSVEWDIEYPAGIERDNTTYDLTNSLKHYGIRDVDSDAGVIDLGGEPETLHIGYEQLGVAFDGHLYGEEFETEMTTKLMDMATSATFGGTGVQTRDVVDYISLTPISTILPPTVLSTGEHRIEVS